MLLLQRTKKAIYDCNLDVKPVVYFYAEDKSCEIECGALETQLEQVKSACPSVRVFAFPYNWPDYSFTSFLERQYSVSKPATLIIGGEKYDSMQSKEVLLKALGC